MIILVATNVLSTPWYDTKITHTLLGFLLSLIVFSMTQYITGKREKVKYRQTMLSWMAISNASLFVLIYKYSLNKDKINYEKLRNELDKVGSFFYILPEDLKEEFKQLVSLHQVDPTEYDKNKHKIFPLLVSIVSKMNKYGVEAFDN